MKILIHSTAFFPNVGGYETAVMMFARYFSEKGYQIHILTYTPDPENTVFPFTVIRQPGLKDFLRELKWCDVFVQESVSLKALWQLLFIPKPLLIVHHNWTIQHPTDLPGYLKHFVSRFAVNISVSHAIAEKLPVGKANYVIHNAYQDDIFRLTDEKRDKDLVFLGRLVNEKGLDILLKALTILQKKEFFPKLTIIGSGHLEEKLRNLATELGLDKQVTWGGVQRGESLVKLLNQHKIMVVPSVYEEPFGIVALEGLACGCVPVVSEEGGLKEAIGECGITFPNGDAEKLAGILQNLLEDEQKLQPFRQKTPLHLQNHSRQVIGEKYEAVFKKWFSI